MRFQLQSTVITVQEVNPKGAGRAWAVVIGQTNGVRDNGTMDQECLQIFFVVDKNLSSGSIYKARFLLTTLAEFGSGSYFLLGLWIREIYDPNPPSFRRIFSLINQVIYQVNCKGLIRIPILL